MMRRLILYFNMVVGLMFMSSTAFAQYCTTGLHTSVCTSGDVINNVSIGSYSNPTTCSANSYGDYTTDTISMALGSVNTMTLTYGPSWSQGGAVWIDWNGDQDFDDAGEHLWSSATAALSHTDNLIIPATQTVGTYRMRVRCSYNASNIPANASCTTFSFGETEDYTVSITPLPACPPPIFLSASNITSNSAVVHWQSLDTAFNVEYGPKGFTLGSGTSLTANPDSIQITGLSPNTSYDVYVQNDCTAGSNGTSTWSSAFTFTTTCVAVSTYPNTENFDGSVWVPSVTGWPYGGDTLDGCWSRSTLNTPSQYSWLVYTGPSGGWQTGPSTDKSGTGNYMLAKGSNWGGTDSIELILPTYDLTSLTVPFFSFYYHMNGVATNSGDLILQGSTNGVTWVTLTTLNGPTHSSSADAWLEELVDVTSVKSANTMFRFIGVKGNGSIDIGIDEVMIQEAPPCPKPTGFFFTNISSSGVDVNFLSGGHSFPVEWGPNGFTQGTGTIDTVAASGNTVGGMTANTLIDVYIQNNCTDSAKGVSAWAGPYTFRTLCVAQAQGYSNNFDVNTPPELDPCWAMLTGGGFTPGTAETWAMPSWSQLQAYSVPNVTRLSKGSSDHTTLITPELVGLDGDSSQIRFQLGHDAFSGATMDLLYGTMSSRDDTSSFVLIDTLNLTAPNMWESFTLLLDNVPAGHKYVAFLHAGNNSTWTNFYFDDFNFEPIPNCLPPTMMAASNVSNTSAIVSWTMGATGSINMEYGPTGFTQGTGTMVLGATGTSDTLTNLTANYCYDVYFQTDCGAGSTSPWVGPVSFCTLCNPMVAPWTDNLDGTSWAPDNLNFDARNGVFDPCWNSTPDGLTTPSWRVRSNPTGSGSTGPDTDNSGLGNYVYLETSGGVAGDFGDLETPQIDVSNLTQPQLKFYYHMYGAAMGKLLVQVAYDNGSFMVVDSIVGQQHTSGSAAFNKQIVLLDTGKTIAQIRFRGVRGTSFSGDMAIDDVTVEEAPSCPDPTGVIASMLQGYSGQIDWNSTPGAVGYKVEYGLQGFVQGTGGGTLDSTTTNTYSVTGLIPVTCYDIYVQANCGAGGTSAWVGPLTFCTTVSCPEPSAIMDSAKSTTSAYIKWTTGGATDWNVSWGPGGTAAGAGTLINVTNGTPQIQLTGLTDCTPYTVWVRDSCGAGDVSLWHGPYNFTTDALTQNLPYVESFNFGLGCWGVVDGGNTADTWYGETSYGFGGSSLDGTPFGFVDSDAAGSGAITLQEELISPPIDASGTLNLPLTLEFDQYYNNIGNDSAMVDVWDGTQWVNVLKQTSSSGAWGTPNHQSINISAYANANLKVRFRYNDAGVWAWYWAVDNVVIDDLPTCLKPTALTATNITAASADLGWTTGGATNWNVEYGPAGFTPGSGTMVNNAANPYALTGLTANTCYDFYVQDSCGAGDVSQWAGPYTFCTACNTYTLPWSDNVDAGSWIVDNVGNSVNSEVDQCWSRTPANGSSYSFRVRSTQTGSFATGPSTDASGTGNFLYTEASNGSTGDIAEVTSPVLDLSTATMPMLNFKYHFYGAQIDVMYIDGYDGTTWSTVDSIVGQHQSSEADAWKDTTVDFSTYAGTSNFQFRMRAISMGCCGGDLAIDEFSVADSGSAGCVAPTALAISNTACDSATLSWTSDAGTMLTFVRFDTTGFDPTAGGTLLLNPSSPVTLSGLMPGTTYDVWVADSCALGVAASMVSFTTPTAPMPVISVSNAQTSTGATSATVHFDASGTTNGGSYSWDFGGGNIGVGDTISWVYTSNGPQTVKLTVSNGCGSVDSTFTVDVQGISIEESALGRTLNVFPNPNAGDFNVSFALEATQNVEIRILNSIGQVIYSEDLGSVDKYDGSIDLTSEAKGMYILQIETPQGVINKRVTIQ